MSDFFFKTAPGQPAFSEEVCTRAFEPTRPYPQNPSAIFYRARFTQLRAYYTKPAPNTPHPNLPQVYFADDVDFQDKKSGVIEWTRIYCTLPTSWNDFGSDAYTFPGLSGTRVPVTKVVTQKIVQDYYLVGALSAFDNLLTSYDNLAAAAWTANGATVTANATTIPACAGGNAVAASVVDSGAANHFVYQGSGATAAKPVSVFLKNGNANVARISMIAAATPNLDLAYATFDLRTGLMIANANATGAIAAIGDGWWRAGIENVVGSQTNAALAVAICDDNGNTTYAATGRTLYAWRGQVPNASAATIPHATVPPTVTPDATNYPVNSADNILVKFGLQYVYSWSQNAAAEYLDGSTSPNLSTYNGYVSTDSNVANSNIYSIESADSTLSLWQGSVWQRQRHFVKAR